MKKLLALLMVIAMCLALTACGKKNTDTTENPYAAMSWQEQYDLGIRLLNEGNYEEAILAFQAVIRIDPKQSEAYQKLADAYIAVGDYDKAAVTLADGFKATGVASLEQQLQQVQAQIEALAAQTGSPAEAPELPRILQYDPSNGFPATTLEYDIDQYGVFTEDLYAVLKPVIAAGQNGDQAACMLALASVDVAPLEAVSYVWHGENGHYNLRGWTVWNGDLLGYSRYNSPDDEVWQIEYRPANGVGFYLSYGRNGEYDTFSVLWGQTSDWLMNGEIHYFEEQYTAGEATRTIRSDGSAQNELLHGEYSRWEQDAGYMPSTNYYVFENGLMQAAFTDPDTGEACVMKRQWHLEDGTERVSYFSVDKTDDILTRVCNVLMGPPMA